jgi:hypothetical protein
MKLYNKILFAFLGGLLLIGCDAENFDQDVKPVGSTDSYPTPSFELQGSAEMTTNENDQVVYTWKVILDKPIAYDSKFGFEATEDSQATIDVDFTTQNGTIAAYDTEVSGPGDDDLTQYLINPDASLPVVEIAIENHVVSVNQITFDWETNPNALQYNGGYYGPCANSVDLDVYVTTTPEFSWDDEIGNYGAATSACPEVFDIDTLSDGTYYFWSDFYSNEFYTYFDGTYDGITNPTPEMPITTSVLKSSTGWPKVDPKEATFVQSDADAYHGDLAAYKEGGTAPYGATAENNLLLKLVIVDGEWTATAN